jgi:dipeptidyl-peptidase 4
MKIKLLRRGSMMFVFICIYCVNAVIQAQTQDFSIEDVVTGATTTFKTTRYQNFLWVPFTGELVFADEKYIYSYSPHNGRQEEVVPFDSIGQILKSIGMGSSSSLSRFELTGDRKLFWNVGEYLIMLNMDSRQFSLRPGMPSGHENLSWSPSGENMTYTIGNNLYFSSISGEIVPVGLDTTGAVVYGQIVHRNEFGIDKGVFWSPNEQSIAFYRMDESMVSEYPLVDIRNRVATAKGTRYPMAGMASHRVTVGVYHREAGQTVYLETGMPEDQYLTNIAWTPDSRSILVAVVNRGQDTLSLRQYDARTGKFEKILFVETHPRYVEPLNAPVFLENSPGTFIWQSRSDGYNHLYIYSLEGKMIKQLTRGEWEVTRFLGFADKGKSIIFQANAEGPLSKNIYTVNIRSGKMESLTHDAGVHSALLSPGGEYVFSRFTSRGIPVRDAVIALKNKTRKTLHEGKDPYINYRRGSVVLGKTLAADKQTELYYRLVKPVDFDSTRQYPLILYVYGGPHLQLVDYSWPGGTEMWQQYMAQRGYVSLTIDNRGTANRGRDFENVIHRQLGKIEMEDQLTVLNEIISLGFVDTSRVGVHGWSYGGFMTISLMLNYPELFKVGVAGGPVTDWKYYEIMYGERYMDSPEENPVGYLESDLNRQAGKLKGRLMVVHGAMDDVVVWQHSLVFLQHCIQAGVMPDYFVYPLHEHNVRGKDRVHLMKKVSRYFDDFL